MHAPRFRVESLHVHPVKACAGLRVPRLRFAADGAVEHDREWVIVDGRGEVTWQGAHPRLALVRPVLDGARLALTAAGAPPAPLVAGGACRVQAWNDGARRMDTLEGEDGGEEAATLLAGVTGAPLRAVRLARAARLRDGVNAVHLASTRSLEEVNRALAAAGAAPVPMARFRPNVVLAAEGGAAWAEEGVARWTWEDRGGGMSLSVTGPCVRCVVPNVDVDTAEVGAEPLKTVARLSRARRAGGPPAVFGVYARPSGAGLLEAGAALEGEPVAVGR